MLDIQELNADLRQILGMVSFQCTATAEMLRVDGRTIERRAEDEQAAVIHWLLQLYQEHGPGWREAVSDYVRQHLDRHQASETGKQ